MVFHYWDLFVVSAYGDKIYRYNGYTGSPRGVYLEGGGLDHPWGLIFDKGSNDTYVTRYLEFVRFVAPFLDDLIYILLLVASTRTTSSGTSNLPGVCMVVMDRHQPMVASTS